MWAGVRQLCPGRGEGQQPNGEGVSGEGTGRLPRVQAESQEGQRGNSQVLQVLRSKLWFFVVVAYANRRTMAFLRLFIATQERRLQWAEDASAGKDQEASDVATLGRAYRKELTT